MKVAIYIRTSTEEQNPKNQLKDCISITPSKKYLLFEEKQSAFKDTNREQFNKVLALIKSRECSDLVVWDLDRVYRNRLKLKSFFELCKLYNCKIHSFRQAWLEDIHNTPEPWNDIIYDLMINILGWMAEDESKKKSDRVKAAVRNKDGKTISYKGNKWGRKQLSTFKINKIYELRKQGVSIRKIAEVLEISIGVVHKYLAKDIEDKKT